MKDHWRIESSLIADDDAAHWEELGLRAVALSRQLVELDWAQLPVTVLGVPVPAEWTEADDEGRCEYVDHGQCGRERGEGLGDDETRALAGGWRVLSSAIKYVGCWRFYELNTK